MDLLYEIRNTGEKLIVGGGYEWQLALKLREIHNKDPIMLEAGRLVAEYFSDLQQLGMIRLRESKYFRPELQVEDFTSVLKDLFRQG